MDLVNCSYTALKSLIKYEKSLVIAVVDACLYFLVTQFSEFFIVESIVLYLCTAYSLHKRFFECLAYSHYFACSLHLRSEIALSVNKLIERPLRELNYNVVERRLEACVCISCYCVLYLVKCETYSDLCRNLCYRITCSL